jgi:hypothetical protein
MSPLWYSEPILLKENQTRVGIDGEIRKDKVRLNIQSQVQHQPFPRRQVHVRVARDGRVDG